MSSRSRPNGQFGDGGGHPPSDTVTFRVIGMPPGEHAMVIRDPDVGGWRISKNGGPWGPGYADTADALRALQDAVNHVLRAKACPECRQAGREGGDLEWVWTGGTRGCRGSVWPKARLSLRAVVATSGGAATSIAANRKASRQPDDGLRTHRRNVARGSSEASDHPEVLVP